MTGAPRALAFALGVAVVSVGCRHDAPASLVSAPPHASATPATSLAPAHPPLLVTIVVDQLAAWIAAERVPELDPDHGGFARLVREGTWAKDVRHAHATTDTAPGHAALYTGAPPRVSGIFANERFGDMDGTRVSFLRDVDAHVVTTERVLNAIGSSAARLRVDTLADRFRARYADAAIVSLSLKDRGAIFGGGRAPTVSLWFDVEADAFVTSTAFSSQIPEWARVLAAPHGTAPLRAGPWFPRDEAWLRAHAKTPDAQPGEGDWGGYGTTFPHVVAAAKAPARVFRASPWADDALLGLALAAVDGEKMRDRPALLALSLSAFDYIGHVFGPDSWEAWDELRRLDAALGHFFDALDARLGKDGWAVMLSADHGATSMPEVYGVPGVRPFCDEGDGGADRWERGCARPGRLYLAELRKELVAAAKGLLGDGAWVAGVADPFVVLGPDAAALDDAKRARLLAALVATLRRHPEIDRVVDVSAVPAVCPPDGDASIDALVCRSVPASPGDLALYVVVARGSFFDPDYAIGHGSGHGSAYLFDRAVPIFARAPGRVAAGRIADAPLPSATFARTAASLLGIAAPPAAAAAPDLATP